MKHTISLLVENHYGVMSRISGLFSGRGYNLDSITVGPTQDPSVSRMTLVTIGDDQVIDQIKKRLDNIVDVINVTDLTEKHSLYRELVMVKVQAKSGTRSEIIQMADAFGATVADMGAESIVFQLSGTPDTVEGFLQVMDEFTIEECARGGVIAMEGAKKHREPSQTNTPPTKRTTDTVI
ncbi:MAG: acetolactate synthase small subunit [Spirochaetales bacterium]|nr:acetolactate synthase small subunit [Spirochaetales bacterium]MCF7939234.1 acetolactate synthase small subunit [Spirochaetales bacterium]